MTTAGRVGFVLKGYPRLSETFIAQEIRGLEARGLAITIYSLRHPTDQARHPIHDEIVAPVHYLPEYLHVEPFRVLRAWWAVRRRRRYRRALALWWRDLKRDFSRNRIRRFGQALVLAHELDPEINHLHGHFLHTPGSVTRYAAALSERPWSVSAHAKDIWTIPPWEAREKLEHCRWLVTCTRANAAYLSSLAPAGRVRLVYHGIDLERFPPPPARPANSAPLVILSVGRAVAKKGYDTVLDALARLPAECDWRFEHIGGGPLLPALKAEAAGRGLAGRIVWHGALPQQAVLVAYRRADLFVLASRIEADGDRDGLPNVLMEAASQGLACIATTVSAIPELIEPERTGVLVAPDAPADLAAAIERLAAAPALRARLGAAAADRVRRDFALDACIAPLVAAFGVGPPAPSARRSQG